MIVAFLIDDSELVVNNFCIDFHIIELVILDGIARSSRSGVFSNKYCGSNVIFDISLDYSESYRYNSHDQHIETKTSSGELYEFEYITESGCTYRKVKKVQ